MLQVYFKLPGQDCFNRYQDHVQEEFLELAETVYMYTHLENTHL
jgi:hypothetical protein